MITDESLLEWYMKGFKDELRGSSSHESDNAIENRAYLFGSLDAITGGDVRSVDYESDEEILNKIKNAFYGK